MRLANLITFSVISIPITIMAAFFAVCLVRLP